MDVQWVSKVSQIGSKSDKSVTFWSEKIPNWSHLKSIWHTLEPTLTSVFRWCNVDLKIDLPLFDGSLRHGTFSKTCRVGVVSLSSSCRRRSKSHTWSWGVARLRGGRVLNAGNWLHHSKPTTIAVWFCIGKVSAVLVRNKEEKLVMLKIKCSPRYS